MNVRREGPRVGTRFGLRIGMLAATLLLAAAAVAYAQPVEAPAIDPDTGALPQVLDLFLTSPIINGIILGLSVISVMLFLYFLLTINDRAMVPPDLVDEVNKLVLRGKYEAASDLCRAHRRTFVATIIQRACENASKGHSTVLEVIDSEGRRRADVMWNRISYLADVANIAPMLGLLGTVLGMITAFLVAEGTELTLTTANRNLAMAIGQAMSTTMFGLIVAIVTLVFYSIIKGRATRVLADAEQAVHSVADRIRPEEPIMTAEMDDRETAAKIIGGGSGGASGGGGGGVPFGRRAEDRR
jgi:biopolymer transport protein ExbB